MKHTLKYLLIFHILTHYSPVYSQTTIDNSQEMSTNPSSNNSELNISELQKRMTRLQEQLSDLNVYLSGLQVRLNQFIDTSQKTDLTIDEKQSKVEDLQQEIMSTDTKLKDAKVEVDRLNQEITDIETIPLGEKPKDTENSEKELSQSLQRLEARIAHLESGMRTMIGARENTSQSLPSDMLSTQNNIEQSLAKEIQEGRVSVSNDKQAIKVKLNGNILFQEAEVSISPEGEQALQKISPMLKNLKDKIVMVIGHSDSKPIGKNLKDFYPTNWELSTIRGTMVVRYLTENLGVDPSILMPAGRSYYEPSRDNMDRRTEIWIFPKLSLESQSLDS